MFNERFFKNSVDALKYNNGELTVPMVIATQTINGKDQIIGFVPGLLTKNVKSTTVEECEFILSDVTKKEIQRMFDAEENFPFFPTDEEIKNDYDNVIKINHLNLKS